MTKTAWENHTRVPVHDPRDDDRDRDQSPRPERSALVMARRILCILLSDTNPALTVECMAVVTGIGYMGDSEAAIARRHGLTRAAVSKRLVTLTEDFCMQPTGPMRQTVNRERCARARYRHVAAS